MVADIEPDPFLWKNGWTQAEKDLNAAFSLGAELDLSDENPDRNDAFGSESWSTERTISSSVISWLLLTGPELEGSPIRLRIRGARISGKIDLGCGRVHPFLFSQCRFDETPFLNDSESSFVGFVECSLPGLEACRIRCSGPVWLMDSHVRGDVIFEDADIGDLNARGIQLNRRGSRFLLGGAKIHHDLLLDAAASKHAIHANNINVGGTLSLKGAKVDVQNGPAVNARYSVVGGSVYLTEKFSATGLVDFEGAKVEGSMVFADADISNPSQRALDLDHANVRLGVFGNGLTLRGTLRMHHAVVGCQVSLVGVNISDPNDDAIRADHLVVDGSFLLRGNARIEGPIDLHGAEIGCTLNLNRSHFGRKNGKRAIFASQIKVEGNIAARSAEFDGDIDFDNSVIKGQLDMSATSLRGGFSACRALLGSVAFSDGYSCDGTVDLADAIIASDLDFSDAKISNPDTRAIIAAKVTVKGSFLGNQLVVVGLVDLTSALISGDLRALDASFTGVPLKEASHGAPRDPRLGREWRGVALALASAQVSGEVDLRGCRILQSVVLDSANVGKSVVFDGAKVDTDAKLAVSAHGLSARTLKLDFHSAPASGVDLSAAAIQFIDDSARSWPKDASVAVDGLTYQQLSPSIALADRLKWLAHATPQYSSQPYFELSTHYSTIGRTDFARRVTHESIRRYYESGGVGLKAWGKVQDWTVGFGYSPVRAVIFFAAAWIIGSIWFMFGASDCSVAVEGLCPINTNVHPSWDPWLYSLDLLVPIVNMGQKSAWDPTGLSKVIAYLLIFVGWVLVTTIAAAAGRKLKRPDASF